MYTRGYEEDGDDEGMEIEGDGEADDRSFSGRRRQEVEDEELPDTLKCPHPSCGRVFTQGASFAVSVRRHFQPGPTAGPAGIKKVKQCAESLAQAASHAWGALRSRALAHPAFADGGQQ